MKKTKDEIIEEYYNFLVNAHGDPIELSDEDIMPIEDNSPIELSDEDIIPIEDDTGPVDLPDEDLISLDSDVTSGESKWPKPNEFNELLKEVGGDPQGHPTQYSPDMSSDEWDRLMQERTKGLESTEQSPQTLNKSHEKPEQPADPDTETFDLHYNPPAGPLPSPEKTDEPEEQGEEGLSDSEIENFIKQKNPDISDEELSKLMPEKSSESVSSKSEYLGEIKENPFDILDKELHKEPPYNTPEYAYPLITSIFKKLDELGEGTRRMPTIWQYQVREAVEYLIDILNKATEKRS